MKRSNRSPSSWGRERSESRFTAQAALSDLEEELELDELLLLDEELELELEL
jgi:hypothetical protein